MEPVGIWLLSIGLADVIAGYSGEISTPARGWWAWGTGSGGVLALALLCGFGWSGALLLTLWSSGTIGLWLWARRPKTWSPTRAAHDPRGDGGSLVRLRSLRCAVAGGR